MNRPRILIVDEEASARSALSELLCDSGYDVATAATGAEGLALVDSFRPDVLLTDVRMPGMKGFAFGEASRGKPWAPRVVFMSAYPRPHGTDALWLSKPINIDELLAALGQLAHGAGA